MEISNITRLFKKKAYLYKDCSDLSIKNFDEIYKKDDFRYLVVGFNGYKDIKVPEGAEQRWRDIFDEWVKLSDDNEMAYYYQLISEVAHLETRFLVARVMLERMSSIQISKKSFDLYVEELKRWKYIYNYNADKKSELERLFNQHNASQNKLGLKRSELKAMREDADDEPKTIEAQAMVLAQITGKDYIDVDTTCVIAWLEICKIANNINEQKRRNGK